MKSAWILAAAIALVLAPVVLAQDAASTVTPAKRVLLAKPFTVAEPFQNDWSKEKSKVTQGTILVVEVDEALARPRQTAMPVLYVNDRPAIQTNFGYPGGKLVLIVPGPLDLATARVYHGSDRLPEQVTAAFGAEQLRAARAAGVGPFPAAQVRRAFERGGERLQVEHVTELYSKTIADLIEKVSPEEKDRAADYRMWKKG